MPARYHPFDGLTASHGLDRLSAVQLLSAPANAQGFRFDPGEFVKINRPGMTQEGTPLAPGTIGRIHDRTESLGIRFYRLEFNVEGFAEFQAFIEDDLDGMV